MELCHVRSTNCILQTVAYSSYNVWQICGWYQVQKVTFHEESQGR